MPPKGWKKNKNGKNTKTYKMKALLDDELRVNEKKEKTVDPISILEENGFFFVASKRGRQFFLNINDGTFKELP